MTSARLTPPRLIHVFDAKPQVKGSIAQDRVGKLGATTSWKLGSAAACLAQQARQRGLWVHMGRVNSLKRLRYAASIGCHSVDGTCLAYGPDRKLPILLGWLRTLAQESAGPI